MMDYDEGLKKVKEKWNYIILYTLYYYIYKNIVESLYLNPIEQFCASLKNNKNFDEYCNYKYYIKYYLWFY